MKTYDRAALGIALGVTCKALRSRAGIAQEDLAYAAGLERAHVSRIERGLGNPNLVTIYKLLPHLNVDFAGFAAEFDTALRKRRRRL
jgi:transcriptional regulator with XRE-family HTH domain